MERVDQYRMEIIVGREKAEELLGKLHWSHQEYDGSDREKNSELRSKIFSE